MGLASLIIALLVIAILLRVDFIFYIVYVCLGVVFLSRWYAPRAMRHLRMQRIFTNRAFLGEIVEIELTWKNTSRFPIPWLEFKESLPHELQGDQSLNQVLSLGGKQSHRFYYSIQASHRGYYRIGPLLLTSGDLFGLAKRQKAYLDANYLMVYPRILPLVQLGLPSRLPFGTASSHQRLFEDPSRPMGVRDYRSGDSLRQINWKVSAHTRDLMVKTYQPAISLETAVLLNLHKDDYDRREWIHQVEWAVTVAASFASYLIEHRQPVGLMSNGIDPLLAVKDGEWPAFHKTSGRLVLPQSALEHLQDFIAPAIAPRNGRAHLMKLLETLGRIESESTIPFHEWVPRTTINLSWGVTLLIITPRGDEKTCTQLHQFVRAGFNPILFTVEPDYNFGQVRERARRLGFLAYNVVTTSDLDRWRTAHPQGNR